MFSPNLKTFVFAVCEFQLGKSDLSQLILLFIDDTKDISQSYFLVFKLNTQTWVFYSFPALEVHLHASVSFFFLRNRILKMISTSTSTSIGKYKMASSNLCYTTLFIFFHRTRLSSYLKFKKIPLNSNAYCLPKTVQIKELKKKKLYLKRRELSLPGRGSRSCYSFLWNMVHIYV